MCVSISSELCIDDVLLHLPPCRCVRESSIRNWGALRANCRQLSLALDSMQLALGVNRSAQDVVALRSGNPEQLIGRDLTFKNEPGERVVQSAAKLMLRAERGAANPQLLS